MIGSTGPAASVSRSRSLRPGRKHSGFLNCFLLFAGVAVVLFLLNSRVVNVFDEGILLTGTMRTMAGNVLHRDFYYNYGPAQLYLLAALFKLFGESVLVERLAETVSAACLVVSMFVLARRFCSRAVSIGAVGLCLLWVIGETMMQSLMNPALCTLTLWTAWLILPVGNPSRQRRRSFAAGLLAAAMFLFRYDMGLGLVAANLTAAWLMLWMREGGLRRGLRSLLSTMLWPYLVGFAIPVFPAAVAYLSVAPLHALLYDVVIYNAKYYRIGRGLPLPRLQLGDKFEDLVVYALPILIALGLWMGITRSFRRNEETKSYSVTLPDWLNMLTALSIAAAVMYIKGTIRISAGQMYGSTIPCILIAAILFQRRAEMNRWLRGFFIAALILVFVTAAAAARLKVFSGRHLQPMVINRILSPKRQPPTGQFRSWCTEDTPITRGFCFLLDDDHIQTVNYLDEHTRPGDYLFVGLAHNDRILISDNITYFATQRMPAVHWTQFDPFLENRADIQRQMIQELEHNRPPYVVLDSEFDKIFEPNGSSVSTGVHLLDNYIADNYSTVEHYGEMTILKRKG